MRNRTNTTDLSNRPQRQLSPSQKPDSVRPLDVPARSPLETVASSTKLERGSLQDVSNKAVVSASTGVLTWQEMTALSQRRKEELKREREEKERRNGLVIIFSMGNLKVRIVRILTNLMQRTIIQINEKAVSFSVENLKIMVDKWSPNNPRLRNRLRNV